MLAIDDLPAATRLRQGVEDLRAERETVAAYLVKIGSPKLKRCGMDLPILAEAALAADHQLYELLSALHGRDAHRRYNALLRELVSFERALEHRFRRAQA